MFDLPIRTLSTRQAHPHQATSTNSIWDGGTLRVPFPSDIQCHQDPNILRHASGECTLRHCHPLTLMPRKFLTQIEIENLMKNLDEENFDDSDSEFEDEFENSILENNEIELDVSANFDEEADGLFSWKEVEGSEMINVLPFSSKSWIES
ncbi:uncharacterized protein TNCV_2042641 [Trichonephila clavipes]|nr:uncharacterized protein TNCV_2042641 [Trichonephila clavipes]